MYVSRTSVTRMPWDERKREVGQHAFDVIIKTFLPRLEMYREIRCTIYDHSYRSPPYRFTRSSPSSFFFFFDSWSEEANNFTPCCLLSFLELRIREDEVILSTILSLWCTRLNNPVIWTRARTRSPLEMAASFLFPDSYRSIQTALLSRTSLSFFLEFSQIALCKERILLD